MEAPSEPIETKPPPTGAPPWGSPDPSRPTGAPPWGSPDPSGSLSGLELVELAGGGLPLAVHRGDLGPLRALVEEGLELVEEVGVALGLDPDRAVGEVLGVAGEAEPAGLALHRPAEAHPLHLPLDHGLQPRTSSAHAWMVTGVPSGSVSARRVMVSLSMRTQPLDTGWPSSHGL